MANLVENIRYSGYSTYHLPLQKVQIQFAPVNIQIQGDIDISYLTSLSFRVIHLYQAPKTNMNNQWTFCYALQKMFIMIIYH